MNKLYKRFFTIITALILGLGNLLAQGTRDDYTNSYLTIECLASVGSIKLNIPAELTPAEMTSVSYSTDEGATWTTYQINSTSQTIQVDFQLGEKVYFKGLGKQCCTGFDANGYCPSLRFSGTGRYKVSGNIMSLLYSDDFASQTECPEGSTFTFAELFVGNSLLNSAEDLVLPAMTLTPYCYYGLFYQCKHLTKAPQLPATTLDTDSYNYMFGNCTALKVAPDLSATTMGHLSCANMFEGCRALIEAPELPATTMGVSCYICMFKGCRSLVAAPALPATTLAYECYKHMFEGCVSMTEAPELPATTMSEFGYSFMFDGCTSLTEAPALPATTLAASCYESMFINCQNLVSAPQLPATTLALSCYDYMFGNCSSLTEAPALPATVLAELCYACMFFECSSLRSAPELPATTLAPECYTFMFYHCTALTEAPELPATTMVFKCYKGMFDGCTSLTRTPVLTAPVLAFECYAGMFELCSNLQEVTCLATDISATDCVKWWLEGVASSGNFYKAPEMEDWLLNSDSGIPEGWTVANYNGVEEQQDQVVVYPNPVADQLHITGEDIQSVKVYDMQGRLVHSKECGHVDQVEVDFQGFAKGIYIVSILSEGKVVNQQVVF